MASNYWAKIWIDMLDEAKVATLPDSIWRRFIECILLAKDMNQGGVLPDTFDMAFRLRLNETALKDDLSRLAAAGLVELVMTDKGERWFVSKFADRQRASTGAERVQMHRDAKRYDRDDVTQVKRNVTQKQKQSKKQKAEAETEAEAEAEKNGASADAAAAAYLAEFGLAYNAKTRPLAALDADYIRGHLEHAQRRGEATGLAIKRMTDGDPLPGKRDRHIPDELADIIQR